MNGTMTARLEAMGLTEVSTRLNWEGPLHFILAWGRDAETHFRVALRFTPCAIGVCVGDEVGDVTQIPVSWYENYLRNPEVEIYENAYRLIQSELALASQQQQTLFSMPFLTGDVGQFPRSIAAPGRIMAAAPMGRLPFPPTTPSWYMVFAETGCSSAMASPADTLAMAGSAPRGFLHRCLNIARS